MRRTLYSSVQATDRKLGDGLEQTLVKGHIHFENIYVDQMEKYHLKASPSLSVQATEQKFGDGLEQEDRTPFLLYRRTISQPNWLSYKTIQDHQQAMKLGDGLEQEERPSLSNLYLKWARIRGERIVFSGPNTNTNTIRVQKLCQIRIRILFGVPLLAEYEYLNYSNDTEYEYKYQYKSH